MSEFLFQLVRWRIDNLLPNEKVELICKIKANKDKELKTHYFRLHIHFNITEYHMVRCKQMKLLYGMIKRNLYERFLLIPFCSIHIYNSVDLIVCNEVYSKELNSNFSDYRNPDSKRIISDRFFFVACRSPYF